MKIVVVGGGTAGWLTAILGLRHAGTHDYTVVESSKVGIIGVGESTTGFFTDVMTNDLRALGVDHLDFMIKTGATCKLGIHHKAWGSSMTHSYLAPLDGTVTQFEPRDTQFEYALGHLSPEDRITTSHTGWLMRHGLSNMSKTGEFMAHGHALHVDGTLTGQYFKDHCLKHSNCRLVDSEVATITREPGGRITALTLTNGESLEGDLFIDCTGFARLLIKAMGAKWVSYKQWLPVDRGMPFQEQYQEGEQPEAWTTAHAQKNGWMWTTPLLDRKGNGYVYSSAHVTDEAAQQEIELVLGRAITPIKIIPFDAGRQSAAWIDNCVSIGLSSSFLEPLEATSIHTSIVQIKMLFTEYITDHIETTLNPGTIALYNGRWSRQIDDLKDFLVMHYQGGRTDSEFWRYISSGATQTDFVKTLLTTAQARLLNANDFPRYWGVAGWSLYSWVMGGLGLFKNVVHNQNTDHVFEQELAYFDHQQMMQQRYGQNLSHLDYIRTVKQSRELFKQQS
jgi:2-polyprenyl-6-methoxyphenol hydroxylase-like FAD-dependent oxidoreductase